MGYIGKKPTPVPLTASDVTDGIISNAKLAQDVISAETELAVAPADTDEFLLSDAGTLKRIDYSLIKSTGGAISTQMSTINGIHSTTSTSYQSIGSGLSITLTPDSTSSKFLLLSSGTINGDYVHVSIFRGSTNLATDNTAATNRIIHFGAASWANGGIAFLDAPNTTSSTTYEIKFKSSNGSTVYFGDGNEILNTLIAIEL